MIFYLEPSPLFQLPVTSTFIFPPSPLSMLGLPSLRFISRVKLRSCSCSPAIHSVTESTFSFLFSKSHYVLLFSSFSSFTSSSSSSSSSSSPSSGLNFVLTPSEANEKMNIWARRMLLAPGHWKETFNSKATAIHLPFYSFLLAGLVQFSGQARYRLRSSGSSSSSFKSTRAPSIPSWSHWITLPTSSFRVDNVEVNSYASFGFDHLRINELNISFHNNHVPQARITSPIHGPSTRGHISNTTQYEIEDWNMDLETGWEIAWRGQLRDKFREIAEDQLLNQSVPQAGLDSFRFEIEVQLLHLKFTIQKGSHQLLYYPIYAHRHVWPPRESGSDASWSNEENEFVCIVDGVTGKLVGDRTYSPLKVSLAALIPSIGVWFAVPFWFMAFVPPQWSPFLIGGGILTALGVGQYYKSQHSRIVSERIRTRNRAFAFKSTNYDAEYVWKERQKERESQWKEEGEEEYFKTERERQRERVAKKPKRDYYELLNISRSATTRQIRHAFLEQAKKWHPDHHPNNPDAGKMFKKINKSYRILSDPELRRLYDQYGHDAVKSQ